MNSTTNRPTPSAGVQFAVSVLASWLVTACAVAQTDPTPAPRAPAPPSATQPNAAPSGLAPAAGDINALAWLAGCWRGSVNQREFREEWMPLRGGMLLGVTQTVLQGRTQDYAYLRLEARSDGTVRYVTQTPGQPELVFGYSAAEGEERDKQFAFVNIADRFPQKIVYRRGDEGWLYASVEGKLNGEDRRVTYPMRRIGCESGEVLK